MAKISILDTTLRDGDQAAGVAFSPDEKMQIAERLEALRVDVIEAGFPGASETELETVRAIAGRIRNSVVSAFARGTRGDIERAAEALRPARSPRIEIAVPVSDIHIARQLGRSREDALEMTRAGVLMARNLVGDVQWIGVDSTRADRDYLARHMETAIAAGASTVAIADTVGFATPMEMDSLVRHVLATAEGLDRAVLSVHCHDDLGLATANTLAALLAGAREVQCTVNGVGERAGNAALEEIVMAITVRQALYPFEMNIDTTGLGGLSRLVAEASGFAVAPNKAVVGSNAFAHGSGMHQDALLKDSETYQIMDPGLVGGGEQKIVIGPHSGRKGLHHKLTQMGYHLDPPVLDRVMAAVKTYSAGRKMLSDADLAEIVAACQAGAAGTGDMR